MRYSKNIFRAFRVFRGKYFLTLAKAARPKL